MVYGTSHSLRNGAIESSHDERTLEVDETYVGGKQVYGPHGLRKNKSTKAPVVSLVERGGKVRSFHMEMVTGKTLKQVVKENVGKDAHIMTDIRAMADSTNTFAATAR